MPSLLQSTDQPFELAYYILGNGIPRFLIGKDLPTTVTEIALKASLRDTLISWSKRRLVIS